MTIQRRVHTLKLKGILALVLLVLGTTAFAQNLKDDIVNNDLDGLKAKVALLEPDFKGYSYIAYYLKNTKEYQQVMLDYLVSKGASPDQIDEAGVGPLYYAIDTDNLEAVMTLIAAKAKVNAEWKKPRDVDWEYNLQVFDVKKASFVYEGKENLTLRPLAVALYCSNTDIVPALLKAGADPLGWLYLIKDVKLSTATKTVYSWSNSIFDHMVGCFAVSGGELENISSTFFANAVAVWKAVQALPVAKRPVVAPALTANLFAYFAMGSMKEFKAELVKTGANTLSFLPYAALAGNWDIVDLILKYNTLEVDDYFDDSKQSLLAWSIANLHAGASRLLLEHGAVMPATVSIRTNYDRVTYVPLVWAAGRGKSEMVKVLLEFKANPNTGKPIFFTHSSPAVRKLLIDAVADTSALMSYNQSSVNGSLLFDAAYDDQPEAVSFWLECGLDPNGTGSGQPLIAAVLKGNPESVKLLLAKGAFPGVILDSEASTLFEIDNSYLYKPIVEYARYKASRTESPLAKSRASQIVKLLEKAQATVISGEYALGVAGPAGGLVFFDKGYTSDGWRYLEVSLLDQGREIQWYNGKSIDIKTTRGLGSGKANTEAIIKAQGPGIYAATLCADLETNGLSDWFLPSIDELALMYLNLQKAALGSFGGVFFWSSSQHSDYYYAKGQGFSDGRQSYDNKNGKYAVRACRAF